MPIIEISVDLTSEGRTSLHPSGPALSVRSFLGLALRRACCPAWKRSANCGACKGADKCAYARVFRGLIPNHEYDASLAPLEPLSHFLPDLYGELRAMRGEPFPAFAVRTADQSVLLDAGAPFCFSVTVAANHIHAGNFIADALAQNINTGLGINADAPGNGQGHTRSNGAFNINSVRIREVTIPAAHTENGKDHEAWVLECAAPLRLPRLHEKQNPFEELLRACRRRAAMLLPALDNTSYQAVLHAVAQSVDHEGNTIECKSEIDWSDNPGRRSRSGAAYSLGGYTGRFIIRGPVAPHLPLLHLCAHTGIGRKTTHGLGTLRIAAYGQCKYAGKNEEHGNSAASGNTEHLSNTAASGSCGPRNSPKECVRV